MEKIKWKIKFIGLTDVTWNKYDFHLTPVLSFCKASNITETDEGVAHGLSLEWGHWAIILLRAHTRPKSLPS